MKQFYEIYKDDEKVSPLVTQLSWSNHLKIMSMIRVCYKGSLKSIQKLMKKQMNKIIL